MSDHEKDAVVLQELKRLLKEIEGQLEKPKIIFEEKLLFNKKLVIYIESMTIGGFVFSYNTTLESSKFQSATRKQKFECLVSFWDTLSKLIK